MQALYGDAKLQALPRVAGWCRSRAEYKELRKLIIDVILHTDMVHHGAMQNSCKAFIHNNSEVLETVEGPDDYLPDEIVALFKEPESKQMISRLLVHGADIMNAARPWAAAHSWASRVMEEFFCQGDREKDLGLPVGMLNDRTKVKVPNCQIGFMQFVYAPFVCTKVRTVRTWAPCAEFLVGNLRQWEELHSKSQVDENGEPPKKIEPDARVQKMCDDLIGCQERLKKDSLQEPEPEHQVGNSMPRLDTPHAHVSSGASDGSSCIATNAATPFEGLQSPIGVGASRRVVREVRRWRESSQPRSKNDDACQGDTGRELVLLYMMPAPSMPKHAGARPLRPKYSQRVRHSHLSSSSTGSVGSHPAAAAANGQHSASLDSPPSPARAVSKAGSCSVSEAPSSPAKAGTSPHSADHAGAAAASTATSTPAEREAMQAWALQLAGIGTIDGLISLDGSSSLAPQRAADSVVAALGTNTFETLLNELLKLRTTNDADGSMNERLSWRRLSSASKGLPS
eukprot:TRINITY_DN13586_c0_g1_i1.p1 TRINITY_DN13586_c0_g1~~TRINITY_DN13586_c0_g1_i1.p1  ORF type:complete len:512 (+),score=108.10 TRINITY_DN13586_c0_g1_i1:111-1646(+)